MTQIRMRAEYMECCKWMRNCSSTILDNYSLDVKFIPMGAGLSNGNTTDLSALSESQQISYETALREVGLQMELQEAASRRAMDGLRGIRDTLQSRLDPKGEMKNLVHALRLEAQYYDDCLATLNHFGFLNKGDSPFSFEDVRRSFSRDELELALRFQSPSLLIMPVASFGSVIRSMNKHKIDDQIAFADRRNYDTRVPRSEKGLNTRWRASIVEGAEEMRIAMFDNAELTFRERIGLMKENRPNGSYGIDRYQYAFLQMGKMLKHTHVDRPRRFFTILDADEALSYSCIPYAEYNYNQINFCAGGPEGCDKNARFRSTVGGHKDLEFAAGA